MRFLVVLILIAACKQVWATGLLAPALNNVYYGFHDCAAIQQVHLSKINPNQCARWPYSTAGVDALGILENVTFENSRNIFENKNQCLKDYKSALINTAVSKKENRLKLTALWLNRKKAQLLLTNCRKIDEALTIRNASAVRRQPAVTKLTESENFFLTKNFPDLKLKYYPMCKTPYQMDALETVVKLSESAAPFLSSREIYDVPEKNRDLFISEKTGKPVTDAEIRDEDFNSNEGFVRTDERKVKLFDQDMNIYFSKMATARNEFAQELKGKFSSSKLSKLFEEGSARESMDELGVSETRSKTDPDLRRMHYCMRSIYESNSASDVAEMIIMFALIKTVTPPQIAALAATSRAGRIGLASATTLAASAPQVIKACEKVKASDFQIPGKDAAQSHVLAGLPNEFDFNFYQLQSLPFDTIESCRRLGMDKFYIKQQDEMSCAMTLALSLIP